MVKSSDKSSYLNKFASDLACGGLAATVSKTAVAPFDRAKLLLQVISFYFIEF